MTLDKPSRFSKLVDINEWTHRLHGAKEDTPIEAEKLLSYLMTSHYQGVSSA